MSSCGLMLIPRGADDFAGTVRNGFGAFPTNYFEIFPWRPRRCFSFFFLSFFLLLFAGRVAAVRAPGVGWGDMAGYGGGVRRLVCLGLCII